MICPVLCAAYGYGDQCVGHRYTICYVRGLRPGVVPGDGRRAVTGRIAVGHCLHHAVLAGHSLRRVISLCNVRGQVRPQGKNCIPGFRARGSKGPHRRAANGDQGVGRRGAVLQIHPWSQSACPVLQAEGYAAGTCYTGPCAFPGPGLGASDGDQLFIPRVGKAPPIVPGKTVLAGKRSFGILYIPGARRGFRHGIDAACRHGQLGPPAVGGQTVIRIRDGIGGDSGGGERHRSTLVSVLCYGIDDAVRPHAVPVVFIIPILYKIQLAQLQLVRNNAYSVRSGGRRILHRESRGRGGHVRAVHGHLGFLRPILVGRRGMRHIFGQFHRHCDAGAVYGGILQACPCHCFCNARHFSPIRAAIGRLIHRKEHALGHYAQIV